MRLSEPCSLFRTIEPAVPATSSVGLQIMHGLTSIYCMLPRPMSRRAIPHLALTPVHTVLTRLEEAGGFRQMHYKP
jgi:hypothetical protein